MFFRITTTTHIIIIAIHMKINHHKIKITKKNSKLQIIQTKCVKIKPTAYLVFPHFNFKFRFFFLNSNHLILLVDKFDEEFNFTTLNDNQNFVVVF